MKKKIFTLLSLMMLCIIGAQAQLTWQVDKDTKVTATQTYVDNDDVTVKSTFASTLVEANVTISEVDFTHFIQVRAKADPTVEVPDGTDNSGSTTLVITAKKAGTLTVYYRRQSTSQTDNKGTYASNDGKDLKMKERSEGKLIDGTLTIDSETTDGKYGFATKVYELEEGKSYTIWARGTTLCFYGLNYYVEPPKTIYLKPGVWNANGARYAAYAFIGENGEWFDFVPAEEEGVYTVAIPSTYSGLTLVRMNGETTENNWDNKWNQTSDINFAETTRNTLFTITGWNETDYTYSPYLYITKMTVLGDFINEWGAFADGWAMTQDKDNSAVWTVTKENVTLNVKKYELKAAANDEWGLCDIPANNYELNITAKGIYTVTVTVNTDAKTMTVEATKTAAVPIESMTVVGTFLGLEGDDNYAFENGWALAKDEDNANLWILDKEGIELKKGTYTYKIVANNDWNDYQLPAEGNASFTCDEDGVYELIFSANTSTHDYAITANKTAETVPVYAYGVVGKGGIFSAEWSEDNALEMTLNEGIYTWTSAKNVQLDAQTIEFKVIKKAVNVTEATVWYPEGTGNNQTVEIPEAGYYTITVTFNAETGAIASNAVQREKPVFASNNIYFWESPDGIQNQNGGTITSSNNEVNVVSDKYHVICLSGDASFSKYVTITLDNALKAGDEIAITAFRNKNATGKKSGAKLKFNDDTTVTTGDGTEFVNINAAAEGTSEYGTEPNTVTIKVPAGAEGSKTITLTRSNTSTNLWISKIEISRKAVDVEIGSTEWATFSSNYTVDLTNVEGLTAYMVTGVKDNAVQLQEVKDLVPANTGLLLNGAAQSYSLPVTATESALVTTDNLLKPGTGEKVSPITDYTRYVLSEADGKAIFKCIYGGEGYSQPEVPVGKAYLEVYTPGGEGARTLFINGETTGINNVENAGQFTFGTVYNMNGQRVSQPTKGLYIMNGRKVIVK